MLIDGHIGFDEEDGPGVMAQIFCRELMFLDTKNPDRIQIWISSPGGKILDGMQIYSTMLKTKTPIDTYCVGIAASIALPLFAAGRVRCMLSHTKLMTHEASGPAGSALEAFSDTVKTMIISKSGGKLDDAKLTSLMEAVTWIDPIDARDKYGLCDIIEDCSEYNIATPVLAGVSTIKNSWKEYSKILNKIIDQKKPTMNDLKAICNKLDLQPEASESAVIKAIELRDSKYATEVLKMSNDYKAKEEELKKMKDDLDDMTDKFNKAKAEVDGMKDKAATDMVNALGIEADAILGKAVEVGKLKNDAIIIKSWKDKYVADKPGTVVLLDGLGINSKAPDVLDIDNKLGEESPAIKEVRRIETLIGFKYGSAEYMNYMQIQKSRK